jgi:SAM-dependent methyltransferase
MARAIRQQFVASEELSAQALKERLGAARGHIVRALVRRRHSDRFVALHGIVRAGDEVVLYDLDPAREEELLAANALFDDGYYINALHGLWPDERRVIDACLPDGADVLESCCGAGRVTPHLKRAGNRVVGLDASAESVRFAQRSDRDGVRYLRGDALALPFAAGGFSVVCCFENSLNVFFSRRTRLIEELMRVAGRRVILGLRQIRGAPADLLQVFQSHDGYLEITQTVERDGFERLLAAVQPDQRARIERIQYLPGNPRPWGGEEFFAVLDLRAS